MSRSPCLHDQSIGDDLQYRSGQRAAECFELCTRLSRDLHRRSGKRRVLLRVEVHAVQARRRSRKIDGHGNVSRHRLSPYALEPAQLYVNGRPTYTDLSHYAPSESKVQGKPASEAPSGSLVQRELSLFRITLRDFIL